MNDVWVPHDIRDAIVDFVHYWSFGTELSTTKFISWLNISGSKFYNWRTRYGYSNKHNGHIPRDFWLQEWEKEAIIEYRHKYPYEGYRRLSYMMMDEDIVAASPSSVYRVLARAGLLQKWPKKESSRGSGFNGPYYPHEHWHIDIAYINILGTFFYLISILDGYSRYIVNWDIRESMTETDVAIIVQQAKEIFPNEAPRIISDNGPQFIAKDFKELLRTLGMNHVSTSIYYPQSNGKIERFYGTAKQSCIRPYSPLSLAEAKEIVEDFIEYYNTKRLHAGIGYIAPQDKLQGREQEIFIQREQRLALARARRKAQQRKACTLSQQGSVASKEAV